MCKTQENDAPLRFVFVLAADGEDVCSPDGDTEVRSSLQHARDDEPRAGVSAGRLERARHTGRRTQLVRVVASVHRTACVSPASNKSTECYIVRWAGTFARGGRRPVRNALMCYNDRHMHVALKRAPSRGVSGLHLLHGSLDPHESAPPHWHLDEYSRFCTA